MKKLLMGAFLFMAIAGMANAQDTKANQKHCNKTEKCCKKKNADRQEECKDKKKKIARQKTAARKTTGKKNVRRNKYFNTHGVAMATPFFFIHPEYAPSPGHGFGRNTRAPCT